MVNMIKKSHSNAQTERGFWGAGPQEEAIRRV
jgi:hypothetical protein